MECAVAQALILDGRGIPIEFFEGDTIALTPASDQDGGLSE